MEQFNFLESIEKNSIEQLRKYNSNSDLPEFIGDAINDNLNYNDLIYLLGSYCQNPSSDYTGKNDDIEVIQNLNFSPIKKLGVSFLENFINEVRKLLCNEKNLKKEFKKHIPEVTVPVLSTYIMATIGVTNPIALGLATLLLIILFKSLKETFCSYSTEEILNIVKQKK